VATSLLEIVDRGEGEIVLQRVDRDAEPLLTITFSTEARVYVRENTLEVAKAMIQAAIQAAVAIAEQVSEQGDAEVEETAMKSTLRVLH
jgi:hypothetical protein